MLFLTVFFQWSQWKNIIQPSISDGKGLKKAKTLFASAPQGKSAAPQGVVEGVLGHPLGPLPTGLLKPSKVLVTNPRDRVSEVEGKIRNLRRSKVPPLTGRIGASAKICHTTTWKYGTGRAAT